MQDTQDNVNVVRKIYEAMESSDIPTLLDQFADDAEIEFAGPRSIPFTGRYRGREGMAELLQKMTSVADVELHAREFHGAGDTVTVISHERGRSKATGREWESPGIETFTVRGGKIRRFLCLFDTAAVQDALARGTR